MRRPLAVLLSLMFVAVASAQDNPKPLKLLFLGDDGHHRPQERFAQLQPVLAKRGIDLVYTDKVASLDPKILSGYAGVVIYANHTKIAPEQEKALVDYVESGKGFIPLHCASYCFLNSPKYIDLVGGQFQRHGTGVVGTTQAKVEHPILKDFAGFKSWDETYVHTKHNEKDRIVLEFRDEKGKAEPWTWVRTQGKGRVFYTAWGHDAKTWSNPGFQNLVERGIRWAVGDESTVVPPVISETSGEKGTLKPFEYTDAKVPFYPPSRDGHKGPLSKMQLPVEASESIKHMVVPKGMKVELFAADPQIYRPICMNWDARGRLWIAETLDYPNEIKPAGEGRDRIVICEDTDGDGKADKFTVFADKLSIPTSFTFANGGVIVMQAPDTLFLKDSTGGDKADVRKVLFTGWGTFDTHAGPSNLHYGFDNWIYGIVGYSGFNGTVGGEKHKFAQGFYRFKPDGSKLEFLRSTNNNSWGVGFSEDGQLFGSTANNNASVHMPIPNRYYEKVRGLSPSVLGTIADSQQIFPVTDKIRQVDQHGKFTAAAGHALYTARTYPKEYWNKIAFVTEPTGHLLANFVLEPKGGTFVAKNNGSFLASDDEWTAPIMAEVGPDGQMWVIDWYNYIVQHNPTPAGFKTGRGNAYETPLRDKSHGRIVRVVYPEGKPSVNPKLDVNKSETLVAALKSDNMLWRKHAQRLLVERGKLDVVPALIELVRDKKVDEIGLNVGAIHALWTLQGLGVLDGKNDDATNAVSFAILLHPSAAVRAAALLTLPRTPEGVRALCVGAMPDDRLLASLTDKHPQVRLAALLAVSEMPTNKAVGRVLLAALLDKSMDVDPWLRDASIAALAAHHQAVFAALKDVPASAWAEPKVDLKSTKEILGRVVEHYSRTAPGDSVNDILEALPSLPKELSAAYLAGLARGWPADQPPKLTDAAAKSLASLLTSGDAAQARQTNLLAKRWKVNILDDQLKTLAAESLKQLRDEKLSDDNRVAAAAALVEIRGNDPTLVKELAAFLTPRSSPELANGILEAIGKSDISNAGTELAALTPTLTPAIRPTAIRILLGRPVWTQALLGAIDKGTISADTLSLDQKQSLLNHPTKSLASHAKATFAKTGGVPSPDREKVIVELQPLLKQTGDPAAGKAVFMKNCALCHRHGSDGAKIGPDLTGMAVHPKSHLLIEIMDPNRSVEGNYRQHVVTTKKGTVLTGLLASESKTAIEIVDSQAKTHSIPRDEIDELQATTKSLMPEGFEKQLTAKDVVNLLEFLTQRGRFTPLALAKAATAVSTKGMFLDEADNHERLIFPQWTTQTFNGVPFQLVDPQGARTPNVILLPGGPKNSLCANYPAAVALPCNAAVKTVHLLSGIAGWAYPGGKKGTVSMIVRLHYSDGSTEDHQLKNGEHFADYIRRVDVPGSQFAFALRGQQVRYLAIQPKKADVIERIEFVKGTDGTAPVVMAVTVESR